MHDVEHAGNGSDIRDLEHGTQIRVERSPKHNFEPAWEALPLVTDSEGAKKGYEEGTKLMGQPATRTKYPIPDVLQVRVSDPATSAAETEPASKHPGPTRWG